MVSPEVGAVAPAPCWMGRSVVQLSKLSPHENSALRHESSTSHGQVLWVFAPLRLCAFALNHRTFPADQCKGLAFGERWIHAANSVDAEDSI